MDNIDSEEIHKIFSLDDRMDAGSNLFMFQKTYDESFYVKVLSIDFSLKLSLILWIRPMAILVRF